VAPLAFPHDIFVRDDRKLKVRHQNVPQRYEFHIKFRENRHIFGKAEKKQTHIYTEGMTTL
jgi:hypothetical protein